MHRLLPLLLPGTAQHSAQQSTPTAPALPLHLTPHLQLGDSSKFLKGLCVVDDIAFFGIAARTDRHNREDPALNCELAAFDLRTRLLLWRRQLPTKGLLNIGAVWGAKSGGAAAATRFAVLCGTWWLIPCLRLVLLLLAADAQQALVAAST